MTFITQSGTEENKIQTGLKYLQLKINQNHSKSIFRLYLNFHNPLSDMNLEYGLACHNFAVAQWLNTQCSMQLVNRSGLVPSRLSLLVPGRGRLEWALNEGDDRKGEGRDPFSILPIFPHAQLLRASLINI